MGILSFNGNKVITTGGGMILTDDQDLSEELRHLTTTAKVEHRWNFYHDINGYNYRMPNINAALGLGQLEDLDKKLKSKKKIYDEYKKWSDMNGNILVSFSKSSSPNFWLNALILEDSNMRDQFIEYTNSEGIGTRPAWTPIHRLPMYEKYYDMELNNTEYLYDRLVNIPSSPIGC